MKVVPSPGYYIVRPLVIKPKETIGKSSIINPNASDKPEKFHQIEERFDVHPWQGVIVAVGHHVEPVPFKMVYEEGDRVYLKTEITGRNVVMVNGDPCGYITQGDIICKEVEDGK